jgi:hypothetical protein
MKKRFKRNCPKCRKPIYYVKDINRRRAKKRKSLCISCSQKGKIMSKAMRKKISKSRKGKTYEEIYGKKEALIQKKKRSILSKGKVVSKEQKLKQSRVMKGRKPWNKGIPCSEETKRKISESEKGKIIPISLRKRWSKSKRGKNNPLYGKHRTPETLIKISRGYRLATIKRLQRYAREGYQVHPSFNEDACRLIDAYGNKHGYKFKHAMNGGEYFIKDLGYWVDGYDKEKNVVIEVDEPYHFKNGKLRDKDKKRQKEIKSFLKCKFIRKKCPRF